MPLLRYRSNGLLVVGALALLTMGSRGVAESSSDVLFHEALVAETGERDIPKAIGLYQQALKEAGGRQPQSAQILLHMSACYERMNKLQEALLIDRAVMAHSAGVPAATLEEAQAHAKKLEAMMASALTQGETRAIFAGGSQSATLQRDGSVLWWGKSAVLGGSRRPVLLENISGAMNLAINQKSFWMVNEDGILSGSEPADGAPKNNRSSDYVPEPVTDPHQWVLVRAGPGHHLALSHDGTVWAWGANRRGQLGDGSLTARRTPVQSAGLQGIISVSAGDEHSLAVQGDGTVWSWGSNEKGQLGCGELYLMFPNPKPIRGLSSIVMVAAGAGFSLALQSDKTLWVWGDNSAGQLGLGAWAGSPVPVHLKSFTDVEAVAAGPNFVLALKTNGTVWAWGDNADGALGLGDTQARSEPTQIPSLLEVQAITAGDHHNLALLKDGSVWAWGRNDAGQLGDGTLENHLTPIKISSPAPTTN